MKLLRSLNLFVLLFLLFTLNTAAEDTAKKPDAASATTVYITKTGAKYHLGTCGSLKNSAIGIPLEEAIKQGYLPCSICRPPSEFVPAQAPLPPSRPGLPSVQAPKSDGPSRPGPSQLPANSSGLPADAGELYRVNLLGIKSFKDADIKKMTPAYIMSVVDGDTVKAAVGSSPAGGTVETIRLIGVDTPETVAPRKPVEWFGAEASAYTRQRLEGKQAYLAFDWDPRDRYGRLLAYVYLPDGSCLNADIVANGFGHAYTRFPFQFAREFRRLEETARSEKRGLWNK